MNGSNLERCLAGGRFCITAELVPPLTTDPQAILDRAAPLRGLVTAVNVTDGAGARTSMAALAAATILERDGIEPVLQITCRDRNRIALTADLVGAGALGIRNLLPLFGDDPTHGDQPEATSVHDLNTVELIRLANEMSVQGRLPSGRCIDQPPAFFIGAADVPSVIDPAEGSPKLSAKLEAGARFVQTQLCFDIDLIRRYVDGLDGAGLLQHVKILIGLGPIASLKSAEWMKRNLWGVAIPDGILKRLADASDPRAEGRRIGIELVQTLRETPGIRGVHLMAPGHEPAEIAALIRECGN